MKRLITAILLSFTIAAPALAAGFSGFYTGVKVGWAEHKISASGYKEGASAYGIFGGYAINQYLALEAEYTNLGSIVSDFAKITARSASVVVYYPIEAELALFGKLGSANTQEKVSGLTVSRTAPTFGFGAQFIVNEFADFRVSLERYSYGGDQNLNKGTANFYSVGGIFRF